MKKTSSVLISDIHYTVGQHGLFGVEGPIEGEELPLVC